VQYCLSGIFNPAFIAATGSDMTFASMYSLPGPWHFSH